MKRIRRVCALILAMLVATTAGVFTAFSAESKESDNSVAADQNSITIHARQDGVSQLYVYLWNGLPTNDAMSKSYPGDKMTNSDNWFTYTVNDVTKINAIITDANGKQYSTIWKKGKYRPCNRDKKIQRIIRFRRNNSRRVRCKEKTTVKFIKLFFSE